MESIWSIDVKNARVNSNEVIFITDIILKVSMNPTEITRKIFKYIDLLSAQFRRKQ